jgi:protein TonB
MPVFKGGENAMYKWLSENVKYPPKAMKDSVSGLVIIHFIVEKDGTITNAEVLKGIGDGCEEEGLRVVKAMPKWIPGETKKGKPIRVWFNIPIRFTLK